MRDHRRRWDHLEMLLSLLYRLMRCLIGLLAVLVRSDLSKDVELLVLRHENQVLRRQLRGRPRWNHADRLWLAALSRFVNRRHWAKVFPVAPATILRWHRVGLENSVRPVNWSYTACGGSVEAVEKQLRSNVTTASGMPPAPVLLAALTFATASGHDRRTHEHVCSVFARMPRYNPAASGTAVE
jgi:hypothetical protein